MLAAELLETLRDSVRAHLIADVPVGVLLSGGVDSAALTALAAIESSEPVRTFSIGFKEQSFNELERARLVARPVRDRSPRARAGAQRGRAAARAGRGVRRALRRLERDPDLPGLQARGRRGQGRALGGGRGRALRRLLHLRRRPHRPLRGPGGGVWRGRSWSGCRARRRKVSFDYKAKRFVRAARLPPLARHHGWKEIFSADARAELRQARPQRGVRPGQLLSRPATPRPRGPTRSPACRTSTSGSTWSTTCW